jgi:DNA (cytosine-5)-methyltransferase 1
VEQHVGLKTISLFTGVGGLDFGFEAAGYETTVALEIDPIACKAVQLNRPWPLIEGDVAAISSQEILNMAGLKPGEADVLIGGPPCQPFSKSGYWATGDAKRLDDPRADTLTQYLRVLRDTLPKVFLLENVYGLVYKNKDEGLTHILEGIEQINRQAGTSYRVYWNKLNAADYGVPQLRERVFLIGARDGRPFEFPKPTHCSSDKEQALITREPYRTAWDALGDLPAWPNEPSLEVGGKWADLLPTIPEGQNYLWHTNRGGGKPLFGWRTRYWSFLLKLAKDQPSWTIQAQPGSSIGPFHWTNRKLSTSEMCRIQTFPDGLEFECGRSLVQRLLGNAVPSLVAEVLGREIRCQLLGGTKVLGPLKLLPSVRRPFPAREKLAPLPRKYHDLIGDHADHPGEGKGGAAMRRQKEAECSMRTLFAAE